MNEENLRMEVCEKKYTIHKTIQSDPSGQRLILLLFMQQSVKASLPHGWLWSNYANPLFAKKQQQVAARQQEQSLEWILPSIVIGHLPREVRRLWLGSDKSHSLFWPCWNKLGAPWGSKLSHCFLPLFVRQSRKRFIMSIQKDQSLSVN